MSKDIRWYLRGFDDDRENRLVAHWNGSKMWWAAPPDETPRSTQLWQDLGGVTTTVGAVIDQYGFGQWE